MDPAELDKVAEQLKAFDVSKFIDIYQFHLYDKTINHRKVATALGLGADLTSIIMDHPDNFTPSSKLYEVISKKVDASNLLQALEKTENHHIVLFIQDKLSNHAQQKQVVLPVARQPPQNPTTTTTKKTVEESQGQVPLEPRSVTPPFMAPSSSSPPSASGQEGCHPSKMNRNPDLKGIYDCKNVRVLFINNKFDDAERTDKKYTDLKRHGAEVDNQWVKKLFKTKLGMKLQMEENVPSTEIAEVLDGFKQDCIDGKNDGCIVIMSSHGGPKAHSLVMDDLELIHLEQQVIQQFGRDKFPAFEDNPKIFLLNACRNESEIAGEASPSFWDADFYKDSSDAPFANMLVGYSTLPLHFSFRVKAGSFYIKFLHDVFSENVEGNLEIRDILDEVGDRVGKLLDTTAKVQIPEYRVIGFRKKYYLIPQK